MSVAYVYVLCILCSYTTFIYAGPVVDTRDDVQDKEIQLIKDLVKSQGLELTKCLLTTDVNNVSVKVGEKKKRPPSPESVNQENRLLLHQLEKLEIENREIRNRLIVLEEMQDRSCKTTDNGKQISPKERQNTADGTDSMENVVLNSTRRKSDDVTEINIEEIGEARTRVRRVSTTTGISPTGFYATLNSPSVEHLGDQQTIEFDHVFTNEGSAYDPRHGRFTAPVSGMYLFTATVLKYSGSPNDIHLNIVKNGAFVGYVYAFGGDQGGSRVVVLSLVAGDMVWVRNVSVSSTHNIYGQDYTSFSGVLIAAY